MRRIHIGLKLARRDPNPYQPTFRESTYRRSLFKRLTPLAWYIIALLSICLVAIAGVLLNRAIADARNGTELLSDRLAARGDVTPTSFLLTFLSTPAPTFTPFTPGKTKPTPVPTATIDPSRAPWAAQLTKAPDGTLAAPQAVIAKAAADLSAYYAVQRDLSIDDFLANRDEMLTTFFTGSALDQMRQLEQSRDLYALNRSGRFTIEIRNFSADGLSAKAGVITRDWVSDVYDIVSRQLVTTGRVKPNTLTIYTILFDQASGRWKFAAIEEVVELKT